ncbi:peptidase domain-containing protein [Nostoc linckia NIES-25]|nr:peptidase domain-containing protein [Nostoc linckia NIES-25]
MANYTIGTLSSVGNAVTRNNFTLEPTDSRDVFKFSIGSTRDINLALTGISSGDDADLTIYRDNGNGIFDVNDTFITNSLLNSNNDDSINLGDRSAGTYYAVVERYAPGSSGNVTYSLALSTANPSNLLAVDEKLGNITSDITRSGSVNNTNTSDIYSFSIGYFKSVNINLSGLSADLDLKIIADVNNNRIIDSSDLVLTSSLGSTSSENLFLDDAGNYFAQVFQFGSASSNYTLTFDQSTTTSA